MTAAEIVALTLRAEAGDRPVRALEALAALVVNRARLAAEGAASRARFAPGGTAAGWASFEAKRQSPYRPRYGVAPQSPCAGASARPPRETRPDEKLRASCSAPSVSVYAVCRSQIANTSADGSMM